MYESEHADQEPLSDGVLIVLSEHPSSIYIYKAEVGVDELHLLGFTVAKNPVRTLDSNGPAVLDIPPSSTKQLHLFLRRTNEREGRNEVG